MSRTPRVLAVGAAAACGIATGFDLLSSGWTLVGYAMVAVLGVAYAFTARLED